MKKRICSLLLICSMLAGLLPQIVLPQAAAADTTTAAKDGFGLPTEEVTGIKDEATLRNNPYGTLGWVPLFQNHELVVSGVESNEFQTTYEGATNGKDKQMSSFNPKVGEDKRIATVAFDPNGTGKDEYIANLVVDMTKDKQQMKLYVTNKDRKVSDVISFGEDTRFMKELKFYQTRAMLSLAAGDFDGDGKDTLMVYVPGNNKSEETVDSIWEYSFSGKTLTDTKRRINLGDVIDGGKAALKAMLYHDGNGDNELRAHLSVDMEVGDVDMDGIDELAMTVNVNDLKKEKYDDYTELEKSYLTVYDYNDTSSWTQKLNKKLLNSNDGASGRARFAGVTIGYVSDAPSGSMPPEVVAVGYYDKNGNYKDCDFDKNKLLAYSYQYSTSDKTWTEKCKAIEVVTNGFTNTGTKGDDVQNPIAVAAVAADGLNSQEYLFISGSMYQIGQRDGTQLKILDGSGKGHERWLGGRLINNSGILDYAVGNFDGNKQGMEQVYYVEYRKQETFDKQFLKIGQLYKDSPDSKFTRWEDDWTYYDKSNCNLAIATADVNNDAMLAKIQSVSTGYTDPKVMAILEASPHFAEVNDGDIGNSATSIGKSKEVGFNATVSGSFGFDIMAGFEYVAPLIETGGGVEFNTSHTFTVGTTQSTSRTIEVVHSNSTNENMVVMYATPMTYYEYEVKYPDDTKKGNSPKLTSSMTLAVPGNPSMNMVSVDTYNKAASAYEGMQQIGSNLHLGTPGQPNTYRSSLPSGTPAWASEAKDAGHYRDSGTKTQRITASTGSSVNFEYSYEGSVQMYGVVGGFKAGGGYHWGASVGTETVNTTSITKEGTVTGGGDSRYNFDWNFGTWTVPFNGDQVPVLGYIVSNVTAPPSPAQDLSLSEQTTNSMVLSWQSGDRPAEYYKIYRYIENNKNKPFVLIDTVDASESPSGEYEYELKDLASNEEYQYTITSGYYTSQEESVESEIVVGKTLANEMSRPIINGPDNVIVPLNGSTTFHVQASTPAEFSSTDYQWQKRLPGRKWADIEGATEDTYTVKSVTSDLNGAMYRCVVTCYTKSATPISFYSDAATLTVGTPQATAGLTVSGTSEGSGTQDTPYIGQSNFNTVKTTTESVETTVPCTVEVDGMTLNVYKVNDQAGTVLGYVGIGEKKEDDGSVSTVYYAVTKDGETYTAGDELTMNTTYQWKNGETEVTVPSTITPETVVVDKNENENAKAKAFTLSETHVPTDAEYDESKYQNGEQYLIHGKDTVTENGVEDPRYILSTMAKSPSGSGGAEEDTYTVKYYQLVKKAENSYELTELTCTQQTTLGSYTEPSFTLVTEETTVENTVTTSTPGPGTALTLKTETAEENGSAHGAALGNVEYTLTITNTSDGTVSTIVGRTNSSGTDSKTWTAPTAGLYAITTTATGGLTSDTVYYLAGVQSVEDGKTSTTETVYTLESTVGGENKITSVYGTPIALTVQQQTVTKNGNAVTAGSKKEVTENITYTWQQYGKSESREETISEHTFRPEKAGTYILTAYQNYSDTSKRTKLASTTITVKRKPLKLYVTWTGDDDEHTSTEAPENKSAFEVKANGLESKDSLPSAITAACALYDDNGSRKNVSGRFEVTIAVNGEDAAVKSLLEKYELNLTKRMLVVKQDTLSVTYRAGEGGSLSASYNSGDLDQKFESGKNIAKNTRLMFDARSNDGFIVKEWKVNGQSIKSITGNTNYKVTEIQSNGKKVGERLTVAALTETLNVEVAFSSDSHTIIFSHGEGGTLTAALKDGGAVTTRQKIAEGANVTFTAAPYTGMSVARWMVDDEPYNWPGTTDLYRESTLTLENVQKDRKVAVEFSSAGKHTLTFNIESETGSALSSVQISAKLADGTAADLNAVPDGAAVTFALGNLGSNYTVKTWKVDGQEAANSGTQKQFTLRNITGSHTVTAVIKAAQEVTLTFKAVDANGATIDDADIASVTAKIKNGNEITSGSTVGNYSTIEFTAAVNEDYYVSEWTGAEADATDSTKASIASLEKPTEVIAHIAEKPQVTVAAPVNGTVEVAGTRGIQNVTLTGAAGENGHVNMNSTAAITATPNNGYFVQKIMVTADGATQTFDYDNAQAYQSGKVTKDDIQITKDTLVQVIFAEKPTVTFGGDTHIHVTAQQDSKMLNTGDHVEKYSGDIVFTATPDDGYETDNWNVTGWTNVNGAENDNTTYTRSGSIESNVDVHATSKELPQYDFTLSVDSLGDEGDGGTVSAKITRKGMRAYERENLDAGEYRFHRDSDITITATPEDGYRVQDWTINGQTTADTATSQMLSKLQGETTVQVRFVKLVTGITFGPTDETSEGGYISAAEANETSILGDAATGAKIATSVPIKFIAEVKPGYEIEGWYVNNVRDDSTGTGETYTYPNTTSASSIYIEPRFQQVEYDITTGDNVTVNGQNRTTARGGESLTFTAVPPAGQNVTGWTVNGEAVQGSGNTLTWTVENGCLTKPNVTAYHVAAQFSAGEYEVTYTKPANGTLTASVESGTQVNGGTKVTFTAEPDKGYEIDEWTVNGQTVANSGSTYTLNVTENSNVVVTFKAMVPVSAVRNGRNGSIAITANGKTITDGYVSSGSDVTFTVTPENTDDMVQAWQVNGSTVAEMTDTADAPLSYTVQNVTANTEVSATLIERPTYTITVTSEGSGTASAEPVSVKRGGSTTVTAVPSSNSYYLKEWSVNGGAAQAASGNTLALTEIRRNTTVKAVFDGAINYDVTLDVQGAETGTTVAATANGRSINPGKTSPVSVVQGSKLVFTAAPAMESADKNKQMVAKWTVNGNVQDNITNVLTIPSLTGKTDVKVEFAPYEGFVIPASDTNWTVSVVKRTPEDTKPATEIRKNGTVTFTMTPVGERLFRKLTVGGVDCMKLPIDGNVTAVKNGAAYTITVKDVTSANNIKVDAEAVEYQVASSTLATVPTALKGTFDSLDKLKSALRSKVNSAVTEANTAYLDIVLQYKNGTNWVTVTNPSDFPEGGMDVQVPYSTLAAQNTPDSSYNFSVVHMFTTTMNGQTVGGTESLTSTKQSNGITFHVNSLSPFAIGWYKNTSTGGGGGGGGGGGAVAPTTYDIVIPSALANTVKADKTKAAAGDTVTLTAAGEGTLTVTDANGKTVALTDLGSGKYTFKMPSAKVSVGFKTTADQPCDGGRDCPSAPFTDVDTAKWYHLSIDYVLTHKMMNGVSSRAFAPNANLTRGMLVQILYNLEGKPKGIAAYFSDVQADAWYAEAVGWAAANKVVTGYADGTFRPNAAVTREQAAAILYRYAQSKGIDVSVGENTNILSYVDVQQASEYAIPALQWAVGAGVLNGKNGGRLAPTGTATRAEIAAIMQRWCENIIK